MIDQKELKVLNKIQIGKHQQNSSIIASNEKSKQNAIENVLFGDKKEDDEDRKLSD